MITRTKIVSTPRGGGGVEEIIKNRKGSSRRLLVS